MFKLSRITKIINNKIRTLNYLRVSTKWYVSFIITKFLILKNQKKKIKILLLESKIVKQNYGINVIIYQFIKSKVRNYSHSKFAIKKNCIQLRGSVDVTDVSILLVGSCVPNTKRVSNLRKGRTVAVVITEVANGLMEDSSLRGK